MGSVKEETCREYQERMRELDNRLNATDDWAEKRNIIDEEVRLCKEFNVLAGIDTVN